MPQLIFLLLIIAAAWYGYRSFKREAVRVTQRVRRAEKKRKIALMARSFKIRKPANITSKRLEYRAL